MDTVFIAINESLQWAALALLLWGGLSMSKALGQLQKHKIQELKEEVRKATPPPKEKYWPEGPRGRQ
jgi:hypothetical protein